MTIMKNPIIVLYILCTTVSVNVLGHGYMVYPLARQRHCYNGQDYYWPVDGAGIKDEGCRAAFQHVYTRNGNNSAAAQAMFNQNAEYAAMAGKDYRNLTHIRESVVPKYLCGAGAANASARFGDKSGMDTVNVTWRTNTVPYKERDTFYFCPTAVHEPGYFEVYVSREGYDAGKSSLQWSDLELVYSNTSNLVTKKLDLCSSDRMYELRDVKIPLRSGGFVMYVRWQREDVGGEGFYNCVDVVHKQTKSDL